MKALTLDFDAPLAPSPRFDGSDYSPEFDQQRLTGQLARIYTLMRDGQWRTLAEIAQATRDHESSISAQLRNLRKEKFGAHKIDKRSRGDRSRGLFEYRLVKESIGAAHL